MWEIRFDSNALRPKYAFIKNAAVWSKLLSQWARVKMKFQSFLFLMQNNIFIHWRVRKIILQFAGLKIGNNTIIEPQCSFASANIEFGNDVYVNKCFFVDGFGLCRIGSHVRIGPGVKLITSTHDITNNPMARASHDVKHFPITIEDGVWLGSSSIVLPGCIVRTGCVVGAGALITRDTEPNGLYLGVPARRVRDLPISAAGGGNPG